MGAAVASRGKTSAVSVFWEPGMCPPGSKCCAGKSDSGKVIRLHVRLPSLLPLPESFLLGKAALRCLIRASGLRHRGSRQRGVLNSAWGGSGGRLRFVSGAFSLPGREQMSNTRSRLPGELPAPGTRPAPGRIHLRAGTVGFLYGLQLLASQEIAHGSGSSSSAEKREQTPARSAGAAAAAAEAGLVPEQPASPAAGREAGQELASN